MIVAGRDACANQSPTARTGPDVTLGWTLWLGGRSRSRVSTIPPVMTPTLPPPEACVVNLW